MKSNYKLNRKSPKSFWQSLLLIVFLGYCCNTIGQSVTIPAANTNTQSRNFPFGSHFGFQRTSMIYTASEIGLAVGTKITSIAFYHNSYQIPNGQCPIVIRMSNVAQTSFVPSLFADEIIGQTTVLTGSFVINNLNPASGWITLLLTTPFIYTGTNIKVTVETNVGGSGNEIEPAKQFRWSAGGSQVWVKDNVAPFLEGEVLLNRPNVQFGYAVPPINDVCSGALVVNNFPYTNVQTNAENATNNAGFLLCANPMNDGVWYKFQGTGSNMQVGIFNLDASFDAQLDVYTGSCGNLSCVATADLGFAGGNETITFLTDFNQVYFINVGQYRGDLDLPEGNFTMQIFNISPSNIDFNYSSISNIGYENQSITIKVERQGGTNGVCTVDYAPNDGSANSNIDYGPCVGTLTWANGDNAIKNIVIDLLPDAVVDDFENFTLILSNPTNATVSTFPATINIIDATSVPVNDACSSALIATTLPYSNVQVRGQASTNNDGFLGCANPMNNGVWYKFAGTGAPITVTISNVDATFDPQLDIYFGGCVGVNLGCIATADDGFGGDGETITFPTTIGTNYFVNVGHYNAEIDLPEGNFTINIGSSLANNSFEFKNLKVYPNPVTNILNIENGEKINKISIINLLGQELISKNFDDFKTEIDFSELQTGNYFAKMYSNDSEQIMKIVKK